MRFGFALPQVGSAAGPEAVVMVAKRAEDLGFDLDRILWPVNPRAPYPIDELIKALKTNLDDRSRRVSR